jgi:hypothetical protein
MPALVELIRDILDERRQISRPRTRVTWMKETLRRGDEPHERVERLRAPRVGLEARERRLAEVRGEVVAYGAHATQSDAEARRVHSRRKRRPAERRWVRRRRRRQAVRRHRVHNQTRKRDNAPCRLREATELPASLVVRVRARGQRARVRERDLYCIIWISGFRVSERKRHTHRREALAHN